MAEEKEKAIEKGQETKPQAPEVEEELGDSDLETVAGSGRCVVTGVRTTASTNCPTPA